MSQHQKALRLADELMQAHKGHADEGPTSFSEAASELRRLQDQNESLVLALAALLCNPGSIANQKAASTALSNAVGENT